MDHVVPDALTGRPFVMASCELQEQLAHGPGSFEAYSSGVPTYAEAEMATWILEKSEESKG